MFAPMLAIGLTLFSVLIDFSSVTVNHVIVYVFVILLAAAVTSFGLLLLTSATTGLFRKLWRKLLSTLILHELKKRYSEYSINISATGIGDQEGSVVVSLALGENNGISIGDLFQVVNIATKEQLGTVQSMTAEKTSCLCAVTDRVNVEFWEELESRMRRDPSPPFGVAFSREAPPGFLDFVEQLVAS